MLTAPQYPGWTSVHALLSAEDLNFPAAHATHGFAVSDDARPYPAIQVPAELPPQPVALEQDVHVFPFPAVSK